MLRMADYLDHPQDCPWDHYELIACLAPRHVFVNAPLRDAKYPSYMVPCERDGM